MDYIHLSHDKRNWWAVVDIIINIRVFKIRGGGGGGRIFFGSVTVTFSRSAQIHDLITYNGHNLGQLWKFSFDLIRDYETLYLQNV